MTELAIIATIELMPGSRVRMLPILLRHRERCLASEPGTLAFEVLVPENDPDKLMLYERYADRVAFATHWNGSSLATARHEAGTDLVSISGVSCAPA